MKPITLSYKFVEAISEKLDEETLYIAIDYATAVHKCCCGCGKEVVTPLSPTDWKLIYDGVSVSLSPSIGNWSFDCKSHYWIERNKVRWAAQWTDEQIAAGRSLDQRAKARYCRQEETRSESTRRHDNGTLHTGLLSRLKRWFTGER